MGNFLDNPLSVMLLSLVSMCGFALGGYYFGIKVTNALESRRSRFAGILGLSVVAAFMAGIPLTVYFFLHHYRP